MRDIARPSIGRRTALVLIAASAGLLGACADKPKAGLGCPPVSILSDTNRLTIYRAGPGRDLSDIAYEAQLVSFEGDCIYTADNKDMEKASKYREVTLNLRPRFRVTPGPALAAQRVTLDYFVAMPDFYPNSEGRADFSRAVDIPPTRTPIELVDSEIQLNIPLEEGRTGEQTEVYLGFALTEEQLQQNRRRSGGRLGP